MQRTTTSVSLVFGLFFAAVAVEGCASKVDSPSTPTITAEQACSDLSSAYCDKINSCLPLYLSIGWGELAKCKERFALGCKSGLTAPGTSQTTNDLADCAKAAPSIACQALADNDIPAVCQPKAGTVEDGKACATDGQCKSAFCGLDEKTMLCGTCAPKPAVNGACIKKKCGVGLRCNAKDKCVKLGTIGASCSNDEAPCGYELGCVAGKCAALITTEGAPCDDKGTTLANCSTGKGLVCITAKCTRLKLAQTGGECGVVVDATTTPPSVKELIACDKSGYCKGGEPGKSMGKCEPVAAEGAACDAAEGLEKGPKCMDPAHCIDGVCKLQDPVACK